MNPTQPSHESIPWSSRPLGIELVGSSLNAGGAERVLAMLAAGFSQAGHTVGVTTIYGPERDFFPLPPQVARTWLRLGREASSDWSKIPDNVRRVRALRAVIERRRPDLLISFLPTVNVLTLLAAGRHGPPVIVTEHTDPQVRSPGRMWEALRRWLYPRAARLVTVSAGLSDRFSWLPTARRRTIHNPVDFRAIDVSAPDPSPVLAGEGRHLLALGRLDRHKGFDLLIRAFADLASEFPEWRLTILGEGPERKRLEQILAERSLGARVHLPGNVADPFPVLRAADLFAFPSRVEGFGNALVEAMACGLACVASDCPTGPREIVRTGIDGVLIPPDDPAALTAALRHLMRDAAERARLGEAACRSARRFDLARIVPVWEDLFASVVPG